MSGTAFKFTLLLSALLAVEGSTITWAQENVTDCTVFASFEETNDHYASTSDAAAHIDDDEDGVACEVYLARERRSSRSQAADAEDAVLLSNAAMRSRQRRKSSVIGTTHSENRALPFPGRSCSCGRRDGETLCTNGNLRPSTRALPHSCGRRVAPTRALRPSPRTALIFPSSRFLAAVTLVLR
jgi:hypothetical protein